MEIFVDPEDEIVVKTPKQSFRVYCDENGKLLGHDTTLDLTEEEKEVLETKTLATGIKKYRKRTGASLSDAMSLCKAYADAYHGARKKTCIPLCPDHIYTRCSNTDCTTCKYGSNIGGRRDKS